MDCSGYIQVLKRNGEKGSRFPMMERCVIGGALNCDMRMYLKGIANQHCVVFTDNAGRGVIENLTDQFPTVLNGSALKEGEREILGHGDVFTILDRTFQWEYLQASPFFGKALSKNTSFSDRKVTGPLAALQHSASSPRRVAVVTPVRRGDLVQNKNGKKRKSIPASKFYRHSLQDPQTMLKKYSVSRRSCTPHLVATVSALEKKQTETFLDVIEKNPSRTKGDQSNNFPRKSVKRLSVGMSKRKSLSKENSTSSKKARKSVLNSSPVVSTPKKKDLSLNTKSQKSTNLNVGGNPSSASKLMNISTRKSVGDMQSPSKPVVIGKVPVKKTSPEKKTKSPLAPVKSPSKPASPVKQTKTQVVPMKSPSRSASPVKKTKTQVVPMKSPSRSASPVKKTRTPVERGKTPSKSVSSVKKTKTPVASVKTPSKSASSAKKTKTPVAQGKTPSKSASSAKKTKTPVAQGKTPSKSATSQHQEGTERKKSAFVSRLKTPVKRMLDSPSSEQQIAKRLKLDNKSQVSTESDTSRQVRKPLFSEVVKKAKGKKVASARKMVKQTQIKASRSKIKKSSIIPRIVKLANSTGHAESPETIIIRKNINTPRGQKKNNQTPMKARKSVARNTLAEFTVFEFKKTLSPKSVSPGGNIKSLPAAVSPANKKVGRNSVISTTVAKKSPVGQKSPKKAATPASHKRNTLSPRGVQSSKEKVKSPTQDKKSLNVKQTPSPVTPLTRRLSKGQQTPKSGKISKSPASRIGGISKNSGSPTRTEALKSPLLTVNVESGKVADQRNSVSSGTKQPAPITPSKTKLDMKKTPTSDKASAVRKGVTSPSVVSPMKKATPRDIIAAKNKRSSEGRTSMSVVSTPVIKKSPKGQKSPQSTKVTKLSTSPRHSLVSPRTPRQQTIISSSIISRDVKTPNLSNLENRGVSSGRKSSVPKAKVKPASPVSKSSTRARNTPESAIVRKSVSPRKSMQSSQVMNMSIEEQNIVKVSPTKAKNIRSLAGDKSLLNNEVGGVKIPTREKRVSIKEQTPSPVKNIVVPSKSSGRREKTILNFSITSPSSSNLQRTPAKRKLDVTQKSPSSTVKRSKRGTIGGSPDMFNISDSFDLSSVQTPQIPQETFVSPLSMRKSSQKRKGPNPSFLGDISFSLDLNDSNRASTPKSEYSRKSTPRRTLNNSHVNLVTPKKIPSLADIAEIPEVHVTTTISKSPHSVSRSSLKVSPKKLSSPAKSTPAKSPPQQKTVKKSPTSLRASVQSIASPGPRSPNKLTSSTRTPHGRSMSSPNITSSKRTSTPLKTPRVRSSSTPNIKSKTPKVLETTKDLSRSEVQNRSTHNAVSPKRSNSKSPVKKALKVHSSPKNDLRDVRGVKKLLSTPKIQASPKNDLRDVRGLKKLLSTPKVQASPKNDLRDVRGVKKLLSTPKIQASPKNDLRDVRGLKKLLSTPKVQASPKNDLRDVRGVKKLLSSPKVQVSPRNDLSDVRGVKKLMRTPVKVSSPRNDLTNVSGVKELFESPDIPKSSEKSPKMAKTDVSASRTTRMRGRNVVDNVLSPPKRKGKTNVLHSPLETSTPAKRTRARNQHNTSSKSNVSVECVVLAERLEAEVSDIMPPKTRKKHNTSSKTNVSVESITIAESLEIDATNIKTTRTLRKRNITESSDVAVSPPKSKRVTSKEIVVNTPTLQPSEVASPQKGKRTKTKSAYVKPSKPQKSGAGGNLSPSKSDNKDSPLPKARNVRGRTKIVEASVSPKASKTIETSSPVATRRGRTKSTVVETSKLQRNKSSNHELPAFEKVSSPQLVASPPKARRARTKTREVASNISGESPVTKKTRSRAAVKSSPAKSSPIKLSPVKSSLVKTRGHKAKKADTSQNASVQNVDASHSEINSALASPMKKQTRSKRGDTKTVTFTDNAPILLYKSTSPIRPTKKGARETLKSKKVEVSEEPVPTRVARGRRVPTTAFSSVVVSEAVTTRATRSRRK